MEIIQVPVPVSEGSQLISDDLATRKILRGIMAHFSNDELRTLSLVSKLWKSEARQLLCDRGDLTAKLRSGTPCQDLVALANDLLGMTAAPISLCGISVDLSNVLAIKPKLSIGELDPIFNVILERIQWRNLSVKLWGVGRLLLSTSYALFLKFVKRVLEEKRDELVQITLDFDAYLAQFIQDVQVRSFSNLKVLKILKPEGLFYWNLSNAKLCAIVRLLVSHAPKLEKLYFNSLVTENVLGSSSAVLVLTNDFDPFDDFSESVLNRIRIEGLALVTDGLDLNMERFNRIMPVLLSNSCKTLNFVGMDLLFTVPLMQYGIGLASVTELEIHMDECIFWGCRREIVDLVKAFDTNLIFPNIEKVFIHLYAGDPCLPEFISKLIGQENAHLVRTLHKAVKIKHLSFSGSFEIKAAGFFSALFPNVHKISVESQHDFEVIEGHWANLKELEFIKNP